jgi:ribonuclease BN (tRNA processing enzyme)
MTRFAILPLGVGEYFTRKYYNTNFALFLGDKLVQIDCPEPFRRMLGEAGEKAGMSLDLGDVDDVILTHLHGDHCNGLEGLALWKHYVEKKRARLYTSPQVMVDLWAKLRGSMSWTRDEKTGEFYRANTLEDYFDVAEWPIGSTQELYGATIRTHLNRHPVPTFGLRVDFDGRSIGYSGDTTFDPKIIEGLADCDLIVHECNHAPPHTAYEDLMTVDPAIRARMRIVHFGDDFDLSTSAIRPMAQGELIEIPRARR